MTLRSLPSVQISIKIYQVSLLEAVLNQTIAEPLRTRKYCNFYLYLTFHLFLCKTKSSNFLVFSVMVRSDNIAIELIKQRKKNRINIFFFKWRIKIIFLIKIYRDSKRIKNLVNFCFVCCFVKAALNVNRIIHRLFSSTCSLQKLLSLKLVRSYNLRTIFKMLQILGHFPLVSCMMFLSLRASF